MNGEDFAGFIVVAIIVVAVVWGCNARFENDNKFNLEKLRIERSCPEEKK